MNDHAITRARLAAVLLIILIAVAATFSGIIWLSLNQVSDLSARNGNLQSQNAAITTQNQALQTQNNELQNQLSEIQKNESTQQDQTAGLQAQNDLLNGKVTSLKEQISSLNSQLNNLTTAHLTPSLTIEEVQYYQFNDLYIHGSVGNSGLGTAYNAGLYVEAYTADGDLEINMTVPLTIGAFGTDNATSTVAATLPYGPMTPTLSSLGTGVTAEVDIGLFHHGTVSNWTVTPVWTNGAP